MLWGASGATVAMNMNLQLHRIAFALAFAVTFMCASTACDSGSGNAGAIETGASCEGEVTADDYDRTCEVNDDCIAVFEGAITDACRCVNAGIAAEAFEDYEADVGPDRCYDPGACLADCVGAVGDRGACDQGQCVSGTPFPCGDTTCNGLNETCLRFGSDIAGEPDGFSCVALPPTCESSADCECFRSADLPFNVDFCLDEGACEFNGSGFRITCPGG